jgi:hypothetical protein
MMRTNSMKSSPAVGHMDQNSLVLALQDMLSHGSLPELFEKVIGGLCDHSSVRAADENQEFRLAAIATVRPPARLRRELDSLGHDEMAGNTIERMKQAVKPRTAGPDAAEKLPLLCPRCQEVLEGYFVQPTGEFDFIQCLKCGTILGTKPTAASRVEEPNAAPARRLSLVQPIRKTETDQ